VLAQLLTFFGCTLGVCGAFVLIMTSRFLRTFFWHPRPSDAPDDVTNDPRARSIGLRLLFTGLGMFALGALLTLF
jgi:hypothetical protein